MWAPCASRGPQDLLLFDPHLGGVLGKPSALHGGYLGTAVASAIKEGWLADVRGESKHVVCLPRLFESRVVAVFFFLFSHSTDPLSFALSP